MIGNDGSDGAKKALQTALTLATRDGAELHEISVEEHLPRYGALMGELDEAKEEAIFMRAATEGAATASSRSIVR